ncbi:NlpC/P60 family protein [Nakamurella endophytica]|uniref:NlpC/P60 domain-containing protein n=1 Tax=Nakamurella endophytica TaxID=1748367 RepID=A0A917SR50_9ACTN|nr:NlpC/P60 family protein [Nakamurella endophytica]GGL93366.1 hypothetical protein GCM10011594_11530 [Nakamurella endophytica]
MSSNPIGEEAATASHRTSTSTLRRTAFVAAVLASTLLVSGQLATAGAAAPAAAVPQAVPVVAPQAVPAAVPAAVPVAVQAAVPAAVAPAAAAVGGRLTRVVQLAKQQVAAGIPYLYAGGHGARPAPLGSRVDCSGLVRELYYAAFGVDIGGGSGDSSVRLSGHFTRTSHPVPGDVALFGNNNSAPAFHAAIYVSGSGRDVTLIGAPQTGELIKYQYARSAYWWNTAMGYWHFNGATAADSAPPVAAAPPVRKVVGHLDVVRTGTQSITVKGWTADLYAPRTSSTVQLVVDGRNRGRVAANKARPDVNRNAGLPGAHGFQATTAAAPGAHRVCIIGMRLHSRSRSTQLGCVTVTVAKPQGRGSASVVGAARKVSVGGWTVDPIASSSLVRLRITDGGRLVAAPVTNRANATVNRILRVRGTHGFAVSFAATPGVHRVCTVALPNNAQSAGTSLGCRSVRVSG